MAFAERFHDFLMKVGRDEGFGASRQGIFHGREVREFITEMEGSGRACVQNKAHFRPSRIISARSSRF